MAGFGRGRKARLRAAQDLWDEGRRYDAIAQLEPLAAHLHPASRAGDALIAATLATYMADVGDPWRGLELLDLVPLDTVRLTDVHLVCLAARCRCRAGAGDVAGAMLDREAIHTSDPTNPALALADMAVEQTRSADRAPHHDGGT